ncbi:MAG: protein kinase, partial [Pirellulales bacterium]
PHHAPMPELTAEEFAQRAFAVDLVDEQQLRSVWAELGRTDVSLAGFHTLLLRHGMLTSYQIGRLVRGDRGGYFFGEYKVLYQIGAGSFARAYRAVHRDTGQVVAIKALRRRHADDPEVTGQFCREGAVGNLLQHPNIVPIYEVVSKPDQHYLVMEFIEGRSLREFLKIRRRLEPTEALRLMCDILSGLSYAAERGITHRDLKGSNVIVTSRGQAKLLDFGLAAVSRHAATRLLDDGPNPRTIDYVGLERLTGVRKDDSRSDIYFAGCIMYHMLSGRPALRETTDRLERLRTDRFTDVVPLRRLEPALPPYLAKIVDRAMDLRPERRYQRPAEMLSQLQDAAKALADPNTAFDVSVADSAASQSGIDLVEEANGRSGISLNKTKKAVMVVESNSMMQNIFRQAFRDSGYRVLMTSDPQRAIARFSSGAAAQCVVFCASDLGEPALEAFNRFGDDEHTQRIPAVLLLGKDQTDWQSQARQAPHRLAVVTPLRVRQLRELVARLLLSTGDR